MRSKAKNTNHIISSIIESRYCIFNIFLSLSLLISIQACSSTATTQGIPVNTLNLQEKESKAKKVDQAKNAETIRSLSQIEKNKSFIEIAGIPEYRVGPLDMLEITSHVGENVVSKNITVNNRGRISFSFLDDVNVNGLTPSQIDRLLSEKLSTYIKNPRIDIIVKVFNSKSVTILGELSDLRGGATGGAGSGRIYLEGKTTLTDLIALAGGYTIDGDIKNIRLIRQGKTYIINLYDILERGDQGMNVILDDGDTVDIPMLPSFGERIFVMGEVNSQGIYSLQDARDLLGAISLAGNVTSLAKEENTLIVRGYTEGDEGPLVMMANVKALFRKADLNQNVTLEDGDLVYIPRMLIGDINEWISNATPLLDFLFYPQKYQDAYSTRNYLHINRNQ